MAKKEVLDETKKVLELMCESEEKVAHLQATLTDNKSLHQQMDDNLRELRELLSKNEAELEDNQHLKTNVKNWNQELISFAHQIYDYIQELHSNLNTHDTELLKNKDLLCKNKEQLEKKLSVLKSHEKTLRDELELVENKDKENVLEIEALSVENEEWYAKLEMLDREIKSCENFIKNEENVLEEETNIEDTIQALKSYIDANESELTELTNLVEKIKGQKEKLTNEEKIKSSELQDEIRKCETTIEELTLNIQNYQLKCDEVSKINVSLEDREKEIKEEFCNYERQLNEFDIHLRVLEEDSKTIIVNCGNSSLQCEETYKKEEDLKEHIKSEICSFNAKLEHQEKVMQQINDFITNYKESETDLNVEVESKELKVKELKTLRCKLKEDKIKVKTDLEAAVKSGLKEVEIIEQTNKKLEEDIENIISDTNKMKNEQAEMLIEKEEQSKRLKELSQEEIALKQQIRQAKSEKLRKKRKRSDPSPIVSQTGKNSPSGKKKLINWSSESSLEGADTTLWDMARKNMKTKPNTRK